MALPTIQTLKQNLNLASPTPPENTVPPGAMALIANAKEQQSTALANAIDAHVKAYVVDLLKKLMAQGAFITAVGGTVGGAPVLGGYLQQLGAPAQQTVAAEAFPSNVKDQIKADIIAELERTYILTPRT
jgi:hypothetical protein